MADGQNRPEWWPLTDDSLSRRAVLKLAGAVPFLSQGTVAETTRTAVADEANPGGDVTAAERTAVDGAAGRYAAAVALEGTTALVGVPPAPETEESVGRVVVLARSGGAWTRETTLSPDGDSGQFGRAVTLDRDTAIVGGELGADPASGHAGSATVFARSAGTWTRQATLRAPDPTGVDLFGTAVDVAGDTLLVGASAATSSGRDAGAAFVFTRSGGAWRRTATIVPDDDNITAFGRAVALGGDSAAIGTRYAGGDPGDSGAVFVYGRHDGTWRKRAELTPPGHDRDDRSGTALAADGETVIAGAPTETNETGMNAGSAYVFARRNGRWRRQATLRDHNGGTIQFGQGVALDGDVALVGSTGGPIAFERSDATWSQMGTLRDGSDVPATGVALDGPRAVVGAGESPVEVFES